MNEVPSAEAAETLRNSALEYAVQNRDHDEAVAARVFAWQAGMTYAGMLNKGRVQDEALALSLMFEAAAVREHRAIREARAIPPMEPIGL